MLKNIIYRMKYIKTYEQINKVNSMDLIEAVESNNLKMVKELIKAGANLDILDNIGNTALILASYRNNIKIAKELIKAGADWNLKDYDNDYYFLNYLVEEDEDKDKIIEEFPEEYENYLIKKDAEKYNL